jgi:hypothetical protein
MDFDLDEINKKLDSLVNNIPKDTISRLRDIWRRSGASSTEYHESYKYAEKEIYNKMNEDLKREFNQLPEPFKATPDVNLDMPSVSDWYKSTESGPKL